VYVLVIPEVYCGTFSICCIYICFRGHCQLSFWSSFCCRAKVFPHLFKCNDICISFPDSSIKSAEEKFEVDFQETLSESLLEKFDTLSCKEERILRTVK
jgi:hypothetical protein